MSFPRHQEIFPSDGGASPAANTPAHRLDEFPAGYSSAGCSPAEPASASPAGLQYAVLSSCRSRSFHRTATCVLTVCVRLGGKRIAAFGGQIRGRNLVIVPGKMIVQSWRASHWKAEDPDSILVL